MGRGPKPAKGRAKPAVPPKSPTDDAARVRDLEKRLAEAREQQRVTTEILRVISSSPSDVAPVFATIAQNAMHLLDGVSGGVFLVTGDRVHFGASATRETIGRIGNLTFPMPLSEFSRRRPVVAQVLETRAPASAADLETDTRTTQEAREFAREVGFRSNAVVPMLRGGELIGCIAVTRAEARATTDDEMALLQTFADQAVIAIENTRLFNETKEALDRQTATSEILRVISTSPTDLQPVLDALAERAARLCQASDGSIFRLNGEALLLVAHHGSIPAGPVGQFTLPRVRGTVGGRTVLERQMIHVRDLQQESEEFPEGSSLARRFGHRTILGVPLLREGVSIGCIQIRRAEVEPFTAKQVELLKTFADQAVIAIENVRLFTELQEKNQALTAAHAQVTESLEQQTATSEILRVISSSPTDVQPVFDAIAESSARLCMADDALVLRVAGGALRVAAHYGDMPISAEVRDEGVPVVRGAVAGRAVLDRRTIQVRDVTREAAEYPESARTGMVTGWRTILAVPLLREGSAAGAIIMRRHEVRPFSEPQIALLQTFADQAVIAIENVRLFNELQEKNKALTQAHAQVTETLEQQTATSEILRVISQSPTDVQPVFDAVAESAVRLCEAYDAQIFRLEGRALRVVAHFGSMPTAFWGTSTISVSPGSINGRAVLERGPIHVSDILAEVTEFPETADRDLSGGVVLRTLLVVPMLREGVAIGTINLRRTEVRPFSDKQVELLKTFADQAVIAIENVRLFKELQEKNQALTEAHTQVTEALEQQTATSEILGVISQSPTDVQPVFDTIVTSAVKLCNGVFGGLYRFDGELIHSASTYNYRSEALQTIRSVFPARPTRTLIVGRTILERAVIQVPDLEQDQKLELQELGRAIGARSSVGIPMLRDGTAIGAIVVSRAEPGSFSNSDVTLLKTFADQAVIAIENVRLFKELEARNKDLTEALDQQTATSEILRVISRSQTDVQPVFDAIVRNAVRLCGALYGAVSRTDGDLIHLAALYNTTQDQADALRHAYPVQLTSDAPVPRNMRAGTVYRAADVEAEPEWQSRTEAMRAALRSRGVRSHLAVPMMRQGIAIGAINLTHREVGAFSDAQVELVKLFADQAVIAIENVRLFKELEARNRELTQALDRETATGEILRVINSSPTSAEPVFDAILANGMRLCQADVGLLFLVEGDTFRLVADRGASPEFVEPRRTAHRSGPYTGIARAVQERRPIHIEDLLVDRAYIERDPARLQTIELLGARSGVWVPLLKDMAIGVLVTWRREVRRFTDAEIEVLTTFANQAVIAIENVRLLRDLDEKSRQLEVASQHKSEFLANMSHELRTPLNAIIGFSEVLADRMFGELNEKQEEYSKDIHASGQHLLSLINDILDLSKIEAGRMELELTDFDLPTAIENALMLIRERAGRRSIALHTDIDGRLGQVQADERKVRQVALNLLSNAIKFTPEGGRIEVAAMPRDGSVEISVTDTGIGIAPEDQEKVFEEFRQVGTASKKIEGTGLGLTLCRKFVELHGGKIWVQSQLGVGSTFTFTIPVRHGE